MPTMRPFLCSSSFALTLGIILFLTFIRTSPGCERHSKLGTGCDSDLRRANSGTRFEERPPVYGRRSLGESMQRGRCNLPPMRNPAFCGPAFAVDIRFSQKSCELATCVEHPTLDRIARKTRDQRDFVERPFMVVDQVDDLSMHRRQLRETLRED